MTLTVLGGRVGLGVETVSLALAAPSRAFVIPLPGFLDFAVPSSPFVVPCKPLRWLPSGPPLSGSIDPLLVALPFVFPSSPFVVPCKPPPWLPSGPSLSGPFLDSPFVFPSSPFVVPCKPAAGSSLSGSFLDFLLVALLAVLVLVEMSLCQVRAF